MSSPDLSRRAYLILRAIEEGAPMALANEAVASWALDHPEVDLDERRSLASWAIEEERSGRTRRTYAQGLTDAAELVDELWHGYTDPGARAALGLAADRLRERAAEVHAHDV